MRGKHPGGRRVEAVVQTLERRRLSNKPYLSYSGSSPLSRTLWSNKVRVSMVDVLGQATMLLRLRHCARQAPTLAGPSSSWARAGGSHRPRPARMSASAIPARVDSPLPMGARSPKPARRVVVLGAGNFGSCLADVRAAPRPARGAAAVSTSRTRRTPCGCGRAARRSSRTSTRTTATRTASRTTRSRAGSPPSGPRCRRARSSRRRTSCCSPSLPRASGLCALEMRVRGADEDAWAGRH
jgi:hypothetical protein